MLRGYFTAARADELFLEFDVFFDRSQLICKCSARSDGTSSVSVGVASPLAIRDSYPVGDQSQSQAVVSSFFNEFNVIFDDFA